MFIFIGISPIVIIAIAVILLAHVVITGAMILTGLAVVCVSAIITIGIIYAMTTKMHARPPELTYARYRVQLDKEPVVTSVGPSQSPPEAITGPREIHNHLHLEGIDPEAVAAYIRAQYGGDFQ